MVSRRNWLIIQWNRIKLQIIIEETQVDMVIIYLPYQNLIAFERSYSS